MAWVCKEYECPKYQDYRCCYTCNEKNTCTACVDEACKREDNDCAFLIREE